jgi:hypothetical protein
MFSRPSIVRFFFSATAIAVFGACDSSPFIEPAANPALRKAITSESLTEDVLKAVRQVSARFNSTQQAEKAGYAIDPQCVAVPGLGGMGHHWANFALVDPVFDCRAFTATRTARASGCATSSRNG